MLEYDFNELDNDFITIWSNYFITKDKSLILKKLETLAELGQINAIQSWYILYNKNNELIDNITQSYEGNSFNELIVLANKSGLPNEEEIKSIANNSIVTYKSTTGFFGDENRLNHNLFYNNLIKDIKFYKYLHMAINILAETYDLNGNIYIAERTAELIESLNKNLPFEYDYIKNRFSAISKKQLFKNYKKYKNINIQEFVEKDPQLAFALGKYCLLYKKNKKEFAIEILTKLSERPLSNKLKQKLEKRLKAGSSKNLIKEKTNMLKNQKTIHNQNKTNNKLQPYKSYVNVDEDDLSLN